jgi:hypothetical protein
MLSIENGNQLHALPPLILVVPVTHRGYTSLGVPLAKSVTHRGYVYAMARPVHQVCPGSEVNRGIPWRDGVDAVCWRESSANS